MFNLAYPLIQTAVINGTTYEIDMSFDNILRLIDMLNDRTLTDRTQVATGLQMLIGTSLDELDDDKRVEIFQALFIQAVQSEKEEEEAVDIAGNPMPTVKQESKELYSLIEDAEYIYASFMQDYGIDLIDWQGKLHWRKFGALLAGLRDDTKFKKVLEIRQMKVPAKASPEEKKSILDAKRAYALKGQKITEDDYEEGEE